MLRLPSGECEGTCDGECEGTCDGECEGTCDGECEGTCDVHREGACWAAVKMSCERTVCEFRLAKPLHDAVDCDAVAFWTAAILSCKTGKYSARLAGLLGD